MKWKSKEYHVLTSIVPGDVSLMNSLRNLKRGFLCEILMGRYDRVFECEQLKKDKEVEEDVCQRARDRYLITLI